MKNCRAIYSLVVIVLSLFASSCVNAKVRQYKAQVVAEYPHDRTSYTQGLFFYDGQMYESTGLNGKSTFRKVDIRTGKALYRLNFDRRYFLEGSVEKDGNIYMLTWQNNVAFVYDAKTLKYKKSYSYPREGWGLATDGKSLIASDGSANMYFLDDDFRTARKVTVRLNGRPVNDRIRGRRIHLRGSRVLQAEHVSCELHHAHLHTETDAEERHIVLSGIFDGLDFTFESTFPEARSDQYRIHASDFFLDIGSIHVLTLYRMDIDPALIGSARMDK